MTSSKSTLIDPSQTMEQRRVLLLDILEGSSSLMVLTTFGDAFILVADATMMRNEVMSTLQAGFTNLEIEGNTKILIQARQEKFMCYVMLKWFPSKMEIK